MDVYSKETFELIQSERDTARKRHILTAIEMELKRIIPTTTIPGHHCTYPRLDKIQDRETFGKSSVSCPLKPSDSAPLC